MEEKSRWIYIDQVKNIWEFFRNDDGDLMYKIMYEKGEWKKESLIDSGVLEYTVYTDEDNRIHVLYGNIKGELRYCTIKNGKWFGKLLCHFQGKIIKGMKAELIEETMHIFYLLISNEKGNQGAIMHCRWNGDKADANELQSIRLNPNIDEYFKIQKDAGNNIKLFFITDDDDETAFKRRILTGDNWSPAKRLYGIQGSGISFEILDFGEMTYVLNKYKELSYSLDLISIKSNGAIRLVKIRESNEEPNKCMLFQETGKLYASWVENGEIFYTYQNKGKWEEALRFDRHEKTVLNKYDCFIADSNPVRIAGAYGTEENGFTLYFTGQFTAAISKDNETADMTRDSAEERRREGGDLQKEYEEAKRRVAEQELIIQKLRYKLEETEEKNIALEKEIRMVKEERKGIIQIRSI